MRLWAFTVLGLVLAAASPEGDTFETGDWKGRANFDGEGTFTDCTVLRPDPENTTLGFIITDGNKLGMIVANSALKLKTGQQKPVMVHVDGLDSFAAMSDVVAENGLLIPLEDGSKLVEAMSNGEEFRVSVRGNDFKLKYEGIGDALEALKTCAETNRGKSRVEL